MSAKNKKRSLLPAKILIVDDDRRLLAAIKTRFENIGCTCVTCDNAGEAIAHFTMGGIDLVITDLTMPGIDGLGMIGLIRSQSNIPIVVLTGHADDYGPLSCQYDRLILIRKPFAARFLIACVHGELLASQEQARSA